MESGTRISEPARRQHDRAFKADLVEQTLQAGASVAVIARNNGINANLLFKWRRDHRRKAMGVSVPRAPAPPVLVPVRIEPETGVATSSALEPAPTAEAASGSRVPARGGVIEVEVAGARVRLRGAVDEIMLSSVLRALRRSE